MGCWTTKVYDYFGLNWFCHYGVHLRIFLKKLIDQENQSFIKVSIKKNYGGVKKIQLTPKKNFQ